MGAIDYRYFTHGRVGAGRWLETATRALVDLARGSAVVCPHDNRLPIGGDLRGGDEQLAYRWRCGATAVFAHLPPAHRNFPIPHPRPRGRTRLAWLCVATDAAADDPDGGRCRVGPRSSLLAPARLLDGDCGFHNVPFWLGTLWIIPFTIIFVWVYNNTRGSLLIAALFHSLFGVTLSAVPILPGEQVIPITPGLLTQLSVPAAVYPYTFFVLLTWLCALAVTWKTKGQLGYAQSEPEAYQAAAVQSAVSH